MEQRAWGRGRDGRSGEKGESRIQRRKSEIRCQNFELRIANCEMFDDFYAFYGFYDFCAGNALNEQLRKVK
jgi:hypothetical protein